MNNRWILVWASSLGALAVALGAFGAHGLRSLVAPHMVQTWEIAVRYQAWHAMVLLILFTLSQLWSSPLLRWAAAMMIAGMVCFSGSLYGLVLTSVKWWGPVTPLGGGLLIGGWLVLLVATIKENRNE